MRNDQSKYEEAALIRGHYNDAIEEACKVYAESEEIAAYLVLELGRLEILSYHSPDEEEDRQERLAEKTATLGRTKETMHYILDKIHELARDRDKFISDIYTSSKIIDLEERLTQLTPWLKDLVVEVRTRAHNAKLRAGIASEIAEVQRSPAHVNRKLTS